jgi:hypothetical protein
VLILAVLAGCAEPAQDVAPTQNAAAIFTLAYETLSAQQLTRTAQKAIAETPALSPAAVVTTTPTRAFLPQGACDNAAYVSDVTVPDGSQVAAGSGFVKTWMLQNSGTCPWTTAFKIAFVGGDRMGGVDTALTTQVPSGGQSEVSVQLAAPTAAGTYTGHWQMQNALQVPFGSVITVVIKVGTTAECKRSSKTTITIMGHAGPENTTIDYGVGSTVTDQHGDYAFQVPEGWSGTVTPSKAKVNPWSFAPEFRTYSNVQCDLRNENYKATAPPGV